MTDAFELDRTYIHLRPDERAISMVGGADSEPASPSAAISTRAG